VQGAPCNTKEHILTNFASLGLDANLLKALDEEGYSTPTPIQAQAIPGVLSGRDLLGIAQTGTGKTAAFALPILQRLAASKSRPKAHHARALILAPTRELATQIGESFKTYGRHTGLSVAVIFGGVGYRPQMRAMQRGVDVLVATPGRLIDHLDEGHVILSATETFVLDEADQMLDMGFIVSIRRILTKLNKTRQSLFFSATFPREIDRLAAEILKEPLRVSVTPVAKTADKVRQQVIHVDAAAKRSLLAELLKDESMRRTLVFTRTKRGADKVARHLEVAGVKVAAIHGNKSQGQREQALGAFKDGKIRVLVATDIAARGIDVDEISHVVNFELPNVPEAYVHRIGRTARAGAEGIAISLCDREEQPYLRDIEKLTRQTIPATDRRGDRSLAMDVREPHRPAGRNGSGGQHRQHQSLGDHRGEKRQHSNGGGNQAVPKRFSARPARVSSAQSLVRQLNRT
jgi:ATP-dependent RNA helicase RhlE